MILPSISANQGAPYMENIAKFNFINTSQCDLVEEFYIENNISCSYYDEDIFCKKEQIKKQFLCVSLNIQSIAAKFNEFQIFLNHMFSQRVFPDVIAIQETWSIHHSGDFKIDGYNLFTKTRTNGRGGGVGIYVKQKYITKLHDSATIFIENLFESIAVEIELPNKKKFLAINVYRPNTHKNMTYSQQVNEFLNIMSNHIDQTSTLNLPIYYFMDMNVDMLKYGFNEYSTNLLDIFLSYSYIPLINRATRIHMGNGTLIDQIFTNENISNVTSGVITEHISDHFPIFCTINFDKIKVPSQSKKVRCFNKDNKEKFRVSLQNQSWNEVLSSNCPNQAFDIFHDTYFSLFEIIFPEKSVKFNKNYHPIKSYMTSGLLKSRRTKSKLWKALKCKPTPEKRRHFNIYRNVYNKLIRAAKKAYFDSKINAAGKNKKKMWNVLNEAAGFQTKNSQIESIKINNEHITSESLIADNFNDFFTNIGKETVAGIHRTEVSHTTFLPPPNPKSIFLWPTVTDSIIEAIDSLEKKDSKDINGISVNFLNEHKHEISIPLRHIFNLSVEHGIFPEQMKTSKTVPVYKKSGSPLEMTNYRPISLINAFSKIFEKLIYKQLINFLIKSDFFYNKQFGFLPGRSTNQAVLQIINFISSAWNDNKIVGGIFLDIQKAFDSINHQILFDKLENAGIRGIALDWFKSYMRNRKQRVKVGQFLSNNIKNIDLGVLQGSILGVILFLIYINDISQASSLFSVLFADDISSLGAKNNLYELELYLNAEL